MGYTFAPVTDFEKLLAPLEKLYGREKAPRQLERYRGLVRGLEETFGRAERCALFSAPGRTEICGNHTDHQHGRVLAGSVDLDVIAAVKPSGDGTIRIQSEGFPMDVVDLSDLSVHEEERNRSVSILRGLAAWFSQRGCRVEGFDAYTTSNVLKGSGLSSSAAFEVLVANIINDLFCDSRFTPVELAQAGQYAENVYFGKPSGLLDQMASSVGAMVTVDFKDNAVPVVERVDFDFAATGYALCIIDSGADHADLTDEYAAVTAELGEVCACFGKKVLREVPEADFYARLPEVRAKAGDRAVLRAIHVYEDNRRVERQVEALRSGDFLAFLALVRDSGLSSWRFLQNVVPAGYTRHQEVALALALAEKLLDGRGACRVHGGGFAGTIQAFVPFDLLERFRSEMDRVLGTGACHVLSIRPVGGVRLA